MKPILLPILAAATILVSSAGAQDQLTLGFEATAPASATIQEIVAQPDLWEMEVQFKPMRMVWADEIDPRTGETTQNEVWYLVWRAINRPLATPDESDTAPVNELDPLPGPRKFIPQFTLVTFDDPSQEIPVQILPDEILPGALTAIQQIEQRAGLGIQFQDSVSAISDLPEPVATDAEQQKWIYGVAMWRNVDRDVDFFKVICHGFSNGYQIRQIVDQGDQVWRKVIVQKFARPGDRFDPNAREFKFLGQPQRIYQPDGTKPYLTGEQAAR